ncbi:hypothetical protein NG798_16920 [Ancylothrix sp. C2]|uniref:hypothetical protein n=1 Tax=Ancylothrix sp. D3o TaxID=2953691 RepID=UPI0021BB3BA1|nr:hypothetical protein [Ancylothrix sp. D3o]MCT7951487.1 hypothetical protein [Ancylothrix sp. D3o]
MKGNLYLTGILSTATLTAAVVFASVSPSVAGGCPFFSQSKGTALSSDGASSAALSQKYMTKKLAIGGLGLAGVAGLVAAGVAYKAGRKKQAEAIIIDEIAVIEEVVTPAETVEKELTLVR